LVRALLRGFGSGQKLANLSEHGFARQESSIPSVA
jgi:hypothetical protein